ncbi:MAG: hypothetical protein AAFX80_13765, partial [Cyanobacteria bacterium J06639_18]
MKVSFSNSNVNELFAEISHQTGSTQIGSTIVTSNYEQTLKYPSLIGDGWIRRVQLRPGLELMIIQDFKVADSVVLETEYNESKDNFGISFYLTGSSVAKLSNVEEEFNFLSGQGSLGFFLEHQAAMKYPIGQRITVVSLMFQPREFNTFIDTQLMCLPSQLKQIANGKYDSSFYMHNFQMNSVMKMATQQIINCPYQGLIRKLYLESKGIELLAYYAELLSQQAVSSQQIINLKSDEVNRIYHAKEILFKNFQNPPSLINLAKLVGLNDYKLKIGFRQCFGNTVF